MIRQNLLVIGLFIVTLTGCCHTCSHRCALSGSHSCHHKHHHFGCRHAGKCHGNGQCVVPGAPASPLYPGDIYGQTGAGCAAPAQLWVPSCSDCGIPAGYHVPGMNGVSPEMTTMAVPVPVPGGQECGCGNQQAVAPQRPPLQFPPNVPPSPTPGELYEPSESVPPEKSLPPVHDDAPADESPPMAEPAIEPVSWEFPVLPPVSYRSPYSTQKPQTHHAAAIPTVFTK